MSAVAVSVFLPPFEAFTYRRKVKFSLLFSMLSCYVRMCRSDASTPFSQLNHDRVAVQCAAIFYVDRETFFCSHERENEN